MSKSTSATSNPAAKPTETQTPAAPKAETASTPPDQPSAAVADSPAVHVEVLALAEKGEGVLTRFGSVWSFPGVDMDPSGSNLRLPIEHVSAAAVKAALDDQVVAVSTFDIAGQPQSVRAVVDGEIPKILSSAHAGTPDAGTQLPPGSEPSKDAGATPVPPDEAARQAEAHLNSVLTNADAKGDEK